MQRIFCTAVIACSYFLFLTGCPGTPAPKGNGPTTGGEHNHGHDHGHEEGPHKGHLIEIGNGEYHAELVHNDADHEVTIYLLDESLKKSVPAQKVIVNIVANGEAKQFPLEPAPEEGDSGGLASRFMKKDQELCKLLDGDVKGRVNVTLNDKEYTGELAHEPHDHAHEGHEHK